MESNDGAAGAPRHGHAGRGEKCRRSSGRGTETVRRSSSAEGRRKLDSRGEGQAQARLRVATAEPQAIDVVAKAIARR